MVPSPSVVSCSPCHISSCPPSSSVPTEPPFVRERPSPLLCSCSIYDVPDTDTQGDEHFHVPLTFLCYILIQDRRHTHAENVHNNSEPINHHIPTQNASYTSTIQTILFTISREMAPVREIYRVKWNNFTGVLRSNLRRYLQDESFADVTLACEGQRIRCHRMILASASEYFESLLNSKDFPDVGTSNTIIYLKDVKFWELKVLIEYLYNGEITISEEKLRRVSAIAESLKIKGFAGEEGVIDEDIARDLGLTNVRTRPAPSMTQILTPSHSHQVQRSENILKRKAPQVTTPPRLIKIQKPAEPLGRSNPTNSNGISNKISLSTNAGMDQFQGLAQKGPESQVTDVGDSSRLPEEMDEEENELEIAEVETSLDGNPVSSESETEDEVSIKDEMPVLEVHAPGGQQRKSVYKYSQEIRDSVLGSLQSGMSLRQCSDSYGIPRKTIAKWKQREVEDGSGIPYEATPIPVPVEEDGSPIRKQGISGASKRRGPGISIDSGDRAERLEAAMKLALSGTTVRQAAVTYEIPRTTLCAYMKRRGVTSTPKRTLSSGGGGPSLSSSVEDFPFLGLSDLIEDVEGDGDYGEEEEMY